MWRRGWISIGGSEFILCRINKKDLVPFFRISFLRMVAKYLLDLFAILLPLFLPTDSA